MKKIQIMRFISLIMNFFPKKKKPRNTKKAQQEYEANVAYMHEYVGTGAY